MADDRYPVDPLNGNAGLAEYLRELERRIGELEAARPLGNTNLTDGTLTVTDDTAAVRLRLGKLTDISGIGNAWGIEVLDDAEQIMVRATEDGFEYPYQTIAAAAETATTVTSGTFVELARGACPLVVHSYVDCGIRVYTDGSTTGELRLKNVTASTYSSVLTVAISTNAYVTIPAWAHGYALRSGPAYFALEARVASGAGTFEVFTPVAGFTMRPN